MQLQISYKDGSARVVNVIGDFFMDAEIRDRHKTTVVTPEQKAMDIALSGGANPYEIILSDGTNVVYKHVNKFNKPVTEKEVKEEPWHAFFVKDTLTRKQRRAIRKEPLTKKWVAGSEGLTWERGIRLLLSHIS